MTIHIEQSTAPMRDAPVGRPDKCPACNAPVKFDNQNGYVMFECNQTSIDVGSGYKFGAGCARAFAAAVSLRAALETQHKATDDLWNERTQLRAELDAARAEVERYQDTDRQKTNEINILAQENRKVYTERDSALARAERAEAVVDAAKAWRSKLYKAGPSKESLDLCDSVDALAAAPCRLCEQGFPKVGSVHVGTQALGMIPDTPCTDAAPAGKETVTAANKPMDDIINIWTLDLESSDERRAFKNKIRKQWFTLASALDDLCRAAALDALARGETETKR